MGIKYEQKPMQSLTLFPLLTLRDQNTLRPLCIYLKRIISRTYRQLN